jgi:hypothetical protein
MQNKTTDARMSEMPNNAMSGAIGGMLRGEIVCSRGMCRTVGSGFWSPGGWGGWDRRGAEASDRMETWRRRKKGPVLLFAFAKERPVSVESRSAIGDCQHDRRVGFVSFQEIAIPEYLMLKIDPSGRTMAAREAGAATGEPCCG